MLSNGKILTEIPPITGQDSFVIFERHKKRFNFPIHIHKEFELNFISGASGAVRIVGDNVQTIGDRELVLITGSNLEHTWQSEESAPDKDIYEVTIQFSPDLFEGGLFDKKQFVKLRKMIKDAQFGISFTEETMIKTEEIIKRILSVEDSFGRVLLFLQILYVLSKDSYTILSTTQFSHVDALHEKGRSVLLSDYLDSHFSDKISLQSVSAFMNMSVPSFTRFVRKVTGMSFVDYLNSIRIGKACRLLIDREDTIACIAYDCGFYNLSNFNRVFKARKGLTPREFREYYGKHKIII